MKIFALPQNYIILACRAFHSGALMLPAPERPGYPLYLFCKDGSVFASGACIYGHAKKDAVYPEHVEGLLPLTQTTNLT